MKVKQLGGLLVLCCGLGGCGSDPQIEPQSEPAVSEQVQATPSLPSIVLDQAPGVAPGTPVMARGIQIGAIEQATLVERSVTLSGRLDPGQAPTLTAETCARVLGEGESVQVMLELGRGDAVELTQIPACPEEAPPPEPEPRVEPSPEPGEATPMEEAGPAKSKSKGKGKGKAKPASCGDDISFSTLTVSPIAAQDMHLPDGGWRAKIRFDNAGSHFIEISPASSAVFMDKSGAALPVAVLPASNDWFLGFDLPPHSSQTVTVAFHDDGQGKPWVQRIKYSWSCD